MCGNMSGRPKPRRGARTLRGPSAEAGGSLPIPLAEDGSPEASRYNALGRVGRAPRSAAGQTCNAHLGTDPVKAFFLLERKSFPNSLLAGVS